ncbi:MAG: glycerol-3-phosphate 1-O-acyltransferase PlsY [Halothiobacillus sp.]
MDFSSWPSLIGIAIASYLIGSIASAVLVARMFKLPDPRLAGSGNPGATNVLRLGGKKAALITLAGDLSKGLLPVLILRALGAPEIALAIAALSAFLGHIFPLFFGFKGGKGVATAAGALLALNPVIGLITIGTWLGVAFLTRYSSLSAVVAAVVSASAALYLTQAPSMIAISVMSFILIGRHQSNIRRLLRGEETRIGQKKTPAP